MLYVSIENDAGVWFREGIRVLLTDGYSQLEYMTDCNN